MPNGPAIREIRGYGANSIEPSPDRGLLLLYVLEPSQEGANLTEGNPRKKSRTLTCANSLINIRCSRRSRSNNLFLPKIQPNWNDLDSYECKDFFPIMKAA